MRERLIHVRGDWDSWRAALVAAADLEDVHWHRPPDAPVPILHAYVPCTKLIGGSLSHACDRRTAPHRLLVCVLKRAVDVQTYTNVAGRVGGPDAAPDAATALVALERRTTARRPALRIQLAAGAAVGTMALWWVRRRRRRDRLRQAR